MTDPCSPAPKLFYRHLADAFDAVAPDYDRRFGSTVNGLMALQRRRSLALLAETFPQGSHLLEVGCGTGEEAISLARLGHRILATDVSPTMVTVTLEKARRSGVGDRITGRVLVAADLAELGGEATSCPFDGAYSSFGALNCEPALDLVATALGRLLRPGAKLVISAINRWSLWDPLWFGLHGDFQLAARRFESGFVSTLSRGGGPSIPLKYLDASTLLRAFPGFQAERVAGFGVLLPPPHLDRVFRRRPRLVQFLGRVDWWLATRWPFNRCGDHVAIVMQLKRTS